MIVRRRDMENLDPRDGVALRTYYEQLRQWMTNERQTFDQQYTDLSDYFLPRSSRFNYQDVDQGGRRDFSLVDTTGTFSLRTLGAGMFSGMSSPTTKWKKLLAADPKVRDLMEVKRYLQRCDEALDEAFLKSNVYQTLHNSYLEEGLYGTTAFLVLEDEETDLRCYPMPVGSYYISGDDKLRVDFVMRIFNMTARQLVDRFGIQNVSDAVKAYVTSNAGGMKEQWWPVVHVIHRNTYFQSGRGITSDNKPWSSVYYELNSYNSPQGLLQRSGFEENPCVVGRWAVVGENFYGESPAMDCLGDTMALQQLVTRALQAIDKQVDPPMIGPPSLMGQMASVLPGGVTFVDMKDGGFKPAYQVDFELQFATQFITQHQKRIQRALFEDLFLMLASSDRREITAEEIRAKQQEKMLILGPVLERNNDEVLGPLIRRSLAILERRGKLPQKPEVLKRHGIKIEFQSILAQVQRIQGTANIDRMMAFLGNEAAVDQGLLDVIDLEATTREYGRLLDIPSQCFRSPDQVAKMRADRQRQQQQAAQADAAQKMALAAKNLGSTDMNADSALTRLIPGQQPGSVAA